MMVEATANSDTLASFQINPLPLLERMKESGRPVVLTVDGKAEVVVQDATAYQRLFDTAERVATIEGVQRGLEEVRLGRIKPLREVLEDHGRKYES